MSASLIYTSLLIWVTLVCLPWRPWGTRESIAARQPAPAANLERVTVLIPARDEADCIEATLRAVALQGALAKIVLIDDQSADGTAARAHALKLPNLEVLSGLPPEPGWSGKLWALHQGFRQVDTEYTLLLDADIELAPGIAAALLDKLECEGRGLVSVMAALSMKSWWEGLLIPPFIYFFKLLYPFALANGRTRWVAAAAGGCILVKTDLLNAIGGFSSLRGALIDDCTLAREIKNAGAQTWIGLSHDVRAIRPYDSLATIWNMVARTAFTQLRYSALLLAACSFLMVLTFLMPLLGVWSSAPLPRVAAWLACGLMLTTYLPIVRYYRRSWLWLPTLPLAAALYLAMTWTSALRFWRGERSRWKNRVYARS